MPLTGVNEMIVFLQLHQYAWLFHALFYILPLKTCGTLKIKSINKIKQVISLCQAELDNG